MESVINNKGFTISKNFLTAPELRALKKDLSITPVSSFGNFENKEIKVFEETESSISVPLYYARQSPILKKFKEVYTDNSETVEFPEDTISLRPGIQTDCYVKCLKQKEEVVGGGILNLGTGRGKCKKINTPILMFDGSIKMVQDISVGELVMGDDSSPREVLSLARGKDLMYEIIPVKGDSYTVNQEHILCLKISGTPSIKKINNSWRVIWFENYKYKTKTFKIKDEAEAHKKTVNQQKIIEIAVKDYIKLPKHIKHVLKGYRVPIDFPEKKLDFDPYILGFWLGDGDTDGPTITNQDSPILHYLAKKLPEYKCYLQYQHNKGDNKIRYRINGSPGSTAGKNTNYFLKELGRLDLLGNKHIPIVYKCNTRQNRLKLLAGLLDSDGSMVSGGFDFIQKSEKLLDDVVYLCRSLGFACYKSKQLKGCWVNDKYKKNYYYRITISGAGIHEIPVLCPRKKAPVRKQIKDVLVYGITVKEIGIDDYYGFELTGNRRFVLGDFTVTHNTVLGIKLLTSFKLKSLIIVNKIQLMKQWTQELKSKVPGIKIGTIQGKNFDIKDCHVTIGMVQTICLNKTITSDSFNTFGICLIDEAHGIASEVFSKIMFKIRPKYLFGLTATLERKDKMEKLLLWYIGPVLFSDESELKQVSDIRVVKYSGESSREVLLRDGTPAVSTMISNISLDIERTDLLASIIKDLAKDPANQILVLGDRTAQLKHLNAKLPDISGLFIGTLKADILEIAKERQVILATYGMAAEGFNVPRLNCLVFATPRSNVAQSIGRIYRKIHNKPPIIIDIVDNFSIFSRQQYARRKIYKKCILSSGSPKENIEDVEEDYCLIEE